MALTWTSLGLPYTDGDCVDETLLGIWINNLQWLRYNSSETNGIIVIDTLVLNGDKLIDGNRDWRDVLISLDGYGKIHHRRNDQDRSLPGGTKDFRIWSDNGVEINGQGMMFWSNSGGTAYNDASNGRAELKLKTFTDSSFTGLYIWVKTTGELWASCKPSGGLAATSKYKWVNGIFIVRARDDIT